MRVATFNRIVTVALALVVLAGLSNPTIASDGSAQPFAVAFLGDHTANAFVLKYAVFGSMAMAVPVHDDLLLTEVQAAEFLNLSVRTLQSWRVTGSKIPFVRCGRAIRYRRGDLLAWIKANTVTSTTEADARRDPRDGAR